MEIWKIGIGKYWENWKYEKFEKYGIGNMKNVKHGNKNKRGSIVRKDKCKNPKGYTIE